METVTEKRYICEYCRSEYPNKKAALSCQATCKKRESERQQWFKDNPPKYKVGDFIYSHSTGYTLQVKSIAKDFKYTSWIYHGTDLHDRSTWISSQQYAKLLVSRQQADARRIALDNMLQGCTIEDIFFTAVVKNIAVDAKPEIETHITLKDEYAWKQ